MRYILLMQKNELTRLRQQIDIVDRAIIASLGRRKKVERAIGTYKRKHGMKLLDMKRRNSVLKTRVAEGRKKGVQPQLVRKLFKLIHQYSLSVQKNT